MANYQDQSSIIQNSNEELQEITRFLQQKEDPANPKTVLIGGWAVHSYNPWYGSIDIDLITNSKTRKNLKEHLVSTRGFVRARNLDDTKRVEKKVEDGKYIIIDFGNREQEDPFEGQTSHLTYDILDGQTELKPIGGGLFFSVPKRTILLIFKMKAAWDRNYRIGHDESHDIEWEKGKLRKDRADILALLDPVTGGRDIDLSILGQKMEEYRFLRQCLDEIITDADAIGFYGRLPEDDVKVLIERLKELIG